MADTLACPECGTEVESADDLETGSSVPEVETTEDGGVRLFRNRDLFLCKNCKKPLGFSVE